MSDILLTLCEMITMIGIVKWLTSNSTSEDEVDEVDGCQTNNTIKN